MEINLNVPYFSQRETAAVERYGYGACGLVSLRMVLGFLGQKLSIEQLADLAREEKAFEHDGGWIHTKLINIARSFDLKGFRINYNMLTDADLKTALAIFKKEGISPQEMAKFTENFNTARTSGIHQAVDSLLHQKIPPIASMKNHYAQTPTSHLLVIKGVNDKQYITNDPWNFGPNYPIPKDKLDEVWTKRLIVIYQ